MNIHKLKCSPRHWPDYKSGNKNNSLRKDDRNFAVGDVVILELWEDDQTFIGEVVVKKVTHILRSYDFVKMPKNYCILSLIDV